MAPLAPVSCKASASAGDSGCGKRQGTYAVRRVAIAASLWLCRSRGSNSRAAKWNPARKLIYAVLFPLVPFIRLRRLFSQLNTPEKRRKARLFKAMPLIVIGLFCHAFGEAVHGAANPDHDDNSGSRANPIQ